MTPENGKQSPTWRWVAGLAVSILITVSGILYAQSQNRMSVATELAASTSQLALINASKIETLEARLQRIEDLLLRLIERRNSGTATR